MIQNTQVMVDDSAPELKAITALIQTMKQNDMSTFDSLIKSASPTIFSIVFEKDTHTQSLLLHALSSENPVFLEKLLPLCQNEAFYYRYNNHYEFNNEMLLGNGNLLEVCLYAGSYRMYMAKEDNNMLGKAKILLEHINTWKEFDFARFFKNKDLFNTIFKQERSYQLIVETMKDEYLKELLNVRYSTLTPYPALYIFDTCYKKMKVLNKVVSLIDTKVLEQGNTLLHYYSLKNYDPDTERYNIVHENVVKVLLKKGFDPKLANDLSETPEDKISFTKSYKEYHAKYLSRTLEQKTAAKTIKI